MAAVDPSQPAVGVTPDLDRLLSLRFAARQLDIRRRRRSLTQLAGGQRSNFRGRGLEFEEVRGYQPGDDIRAIDWRVTARTGAAHTKLFHEERERPVLLVVDQRPGMHFGSQHCFKSVLAAELAALLAWSALDSNERVGALIVTSDGHRELRPRNSRRAVLGMLSALCATESTSTAQRDGTVTQRAATGSKTELAGNSLPFDEVLRTARRIARTGSSLFLISDFHDATGDAAREELFQLARHTEITALACGDPLEQALPPPGVYAVTDGSDRVELDTGMATVRQQHRSAIRAHGDALKAMFQKLAIPCIEASTVAPPLGTLNRYFGAGS